MDVARSFVPLSIPLHRLFLSIVQRLHVVPAHFTYGGDVARVCAERDVFGVVFGQHHDDDNGGAAEIATATGSVGLQGEEKG